MEYLGISRRKLCKLLSILDISVAKYKSPVFSHAQVEKIMIAHLVLASKHARRGDVRSTVKHMIKEHLASALISDTYVENKVLVACKARSVYRRWQNRQ